MISGICNDTLHKLFNYDQENYMGSKKEELFLVKIYCNKGNNYNIFMNWCSMRQSGITVI